MATILTDKQIAALLGEKKPVTAKQRQILFCPNSRKSRNTDDLSARIRIKTKGGNKFVVRVRQSKSDVDAFSVILTYHKSGMRPVRLVRCNGLHGPHYNTLEKRARKGITEIPAKTFHIHQITERYQLSGKPDGYAEPTDKYNSFKSAVEFMCFEFGCHDPENAYSRRYPLLNE
jgi:hypothetical protein